MPNSAGRSLRFGVCLVALATVAMGCSSTSKSESTPGTRVKKTGNLPHVIVLLEENHSYNTVIGSPSLPNLNALANQGTLLTDYYAITHPSLPNYIAMMSGDTRGIKSDCGKCNVDAPNLANQLTRAGISWKVYAQGLPRACSKDTPTSGDYAKKHVPFLYFNSIRNSATDCAKVVPFSQFATDVRLNQLPTFSFITPDLAHDMHGAGLGVSEDKLTSSADTFAQDVYNKLAASPEWTQDVRLVITFDEGGGGGKGDKTSCCKGLATGGHVATIIVGPKVLAVHDTATYSHYSLLRSIETLYGLGYIGHAADPAVTDIPTLATG